MYHLVSVGNQRVVKILSMLAKDEEVSVYDIMIENNCSERTVYSDIQRISDDKVNGLSINLNSKYIKANYTSNSIIEEYAFQIMNNDIRVRTLFEILYYPNHDLIQYAIDLGISSVHLTSTIKTVNTFLANYDCAIERGNDGYYINAKNEVSFRVMMAEYINTSPDRLSEFKNKVFPEVMYSRFEKVFEYDFSIGYMLTLERFSNMRARQGFSVISENIDESQQYEYILNYFVNQLEYHKEDFYKITESVKVFCTKVMKLDEEVIDKVAELFISTLLRHTISGYIYYLEVDRLSIFCFNFRKRYTKLSELIELEILKILDNTFDINVERFIEEVFFFTYINIPEVINPSPRKVYIVSDLGKEHAYSLKLFFKSMFRHHQFIVIKKDELKILNKDNDPSVAGIISNYEIVPPRIICNLYF